MHGETVKFCLCLWLKRKVHKRNVDTRNELLVRILDDATHINKCADQLRRSSNSSCTVHKGWQWDFWKFIL